MKQMNTMKFTSVALKNLFSKPATRPYPEQPREYPDRTRGHVEVDIDTCVLCSLCARKCPTGAITVDRAASCGKSKDSAASSAGAAWKPARRNVCP